MYRSYLRLLYKSIYLIVISTDSTLIAKLFLFLWAGFPGSKEQHQKVISDESQQHAESMKIKLICITLKHFCLRPKKFTPKAKQNGRIFVAWTPHWLQISLRLVTIYCVNLLLSSKIKRFCM